MHCYFSISYSFNYFSKKSAHKHFATLNNNVVFVKIHTNISIIVPY